MFSRKPRERDLADSSVSCARIDGRNILLGSPLLLRSEITECRVLVRHIPYGLAITQASRPTRRPVRPA
jgi:hypothetical protein